MKKLISLLLGLISLAAYAQSQPAPKTGGVALRVNDSTSYISSQTTAHSQGYADIFWNNQATTPHYDIWNGSSYDHVFTFGGGGGGGTQDFQDVMDQGSSANIGDAAANLTAVNATDYAQWSLTPSSFEIASSNNANTAGATFSVDTDGAHITDTRANRGLQGGADYSANIQANDYAQKVYVDAKVANAINDGTTTIAPAQDAVFDAMALKAATTDIVGTQDLFISAAAMWPRVTGGCSSLTQTELSTSLFNVQSLDFDQSIDEFAQFQVTLPRKWNNGTVTVSVYWTAASGSGNVVWSINGGAYSAFYSRC